MLNQQGFDLWADNYDKTVQVSEQNNEYPFAGYKEILNRIYNEVMQKENASVLDIGLGTGVLASRLYENGHSIDGIDFSKKMLRISQEKMPKANLYQWDIAEGAPPEISQKKFDFIASTYTLHHLDDKEKVSFIKKVRPLLKEDGKILIGDIAFGTREQLEECRQENIHQWDDDEYYFVADEFKVGVRGKFHKFSHCGGIFEIEKK
ncbi:class I SAM-dependent methyltransferase [Halalkalibacillus sediminis]|nr:class I SAM-dependent methyltransferase [Halalkalibacillus sediminis]